MNDVFILISRSDLESSEMIEQTIRCKTYYRIWTHRWRRIDIKKAALSGSSAYERTL